MQGSFEKDVQKKMEELNLTPSAAVWDKVAVEIELEKKRRRGLFWFLLVGLLALGGGWWAYRSATNEAQVIGKKAEEKTVEKSSASQATATPSLITQKKGGNANANVGIFEEEQEHRQKQQVAVSSLPNGKKESVKPSVVLITKQHNVNATGKPAQIQMPVVLSRAPSAKNALTNKTQTFSVPVKAKSFSVRNDLTANTNDNDKSVSVNNDRPFSIIEKSEPAPVKNDSPKEKDSASFLPTESTPPQTDTVRAKTDTVLKKKVAARTKKWKKEIDFAVGRSSYATGGLFGGAASFDATAFNNVSGGTGVLPQQSLRYNPAKTTAGVAFSIGYLFSKPISKKWEFAFGLQYAYASTRVKVGDKKTADTTVSFNADKVAADGFYTNAGTKDYTNRFHSIELPVRISYQPSAKLPLLISAGMAYGYLFATNALTFSSYSNLYYQNKAGYRRHQLPLSVAAQWRFALRKGKSLQVGPVVQYNLLRLQTENSSAPPHLFFAGVRTALRW